MVQTSIFLVVVLCALVNVSQGVVNVTVPLCFQDGITWVVTGGTVNGVTFVETSTSAGCSFSIANAVSQTFNITYTTCGATPAKSNSDTIHQLIIVVQSNAIFNAATDVRVLVRCEFDTGTSSVGTSFVGEPQFPSGTPGKNVTTTINPRPQLALYTDVNGTPTLVNTSTILVQGTKVTAQITLNQNTSDYNLKVESGELSIGLVGDITVKGKFELLNSSTSCALYDFFLSFKYLTSPEGISYAETVFNVTIPTITDIDLRTVKPELRLSFRVALCLKGSGCVQITCPDRTVRRRRQIEDGATGATGDSASYNLTGGFRVTSGPGSDNLIDPDGGVVQTGTNQEGTVCLEKAEFWGLIMGLLGFLILACIASCCLCFFLMRWRRRRQKKVVIAGSSDMTTGSTLTTVRRLTGEPANKGAFVLPRFVAIPGYGNPK